MPSRADKGETQPTAANMPGWKMMSEAIADAINTSGLTVKIVADRTGLSPQYIYSMMKGTCNPSIDKIESVMAAAGTSLVDWINDQALYGREKRIHDRIHWLLNQKGANAIALRRTIEGLMALSAEETKGSE